MICNTYVKFFTHLADPTKLEVIKALREKPLCVSDLVQETSMEQSRVSHTLRKLKEAGFVHVKPNGKQRIYEIDAITIKPLLNLIDKHVDSYYRHYCHCKGTVRKQRWRNA